MSSLLEEPIPQRNQGERDAFQEGGDIGLFIILVPKGLPTLGTY